MYDTVASAVQCHESHVFSCPSERRHHLSAMSGDSHQFDDRVDEVETEYSDFCDDDAIWAAPATIFESYPSSASTLGKRKSLEDLDLFSSPSASYKKRILSNDGAEPYIIVRFIRCFLSTTKARGGRHTTLASNVRWTAADSPGAFNGRSLVSSRSTIARGTIFLCRASIVFARRGCLLRIPILLLRPFCVLVLPLSSRTSSDGISTALVVLGCRRKINPL